MKNLIENPNKCRMASFMKILSAASVLCASVACNNAETFDAAGYFEAETVTVSSEATGRITELSISEGDQVKKGDLVGVIDSTQLYLNKLQLISNARSIESNRPDVSLQLSALESQLANLKTEKTRVEKLVEADAAPQKQADEICYNISVLESQIAAQKSGLQNSVNSIDAQSSAIDVQIALIDNQLENCRIVAPFDGTVLSIYSKKDEFVSTGNPVYKLADLDEMTLKAYITSDKMYDLKLGQKVGVTAVFGDGKERRYDGTVTYISPQSEFTPKNIPTDNERADMVYAIKIRVKNDGYIKIGTYGTVTL